jgi:hypothetical protein
VLYLTFFEPSLSTPSPSLSAYHLFRINKTSGAVAQSDFPGDMVPIITTSAAGVHQFWQMPFGFASLGRVSPTLQFVDETGAVLYSAVASPLATAAAGGINLDNSTGDTRFIFAIPTSNTSSTVEGGDLLSYDPTTRAATALGKLPKTPNGSLYALSFSVQASEGQGGFGVGIAQPYYEISGPAPANPPPATVFTFDLNTANSLKYTTTLK